MTEARRSEASRAEASRAEPSRAEPSKGERTRRKLVDATATLLRRQGYHATGLSEIVAESGAPRGSLYFHFPGGKDELARAALIAAGDAWRVRIDAVIAASPDVSAAIDAIATLLGDDLEASGWDNGCPVAAVALEATSEPVRRTIEAHYTAWLAAIAGRLAGLGIPAAVTRQLALVALSAFEGALLLARVQRSREPLVSVAAALRAMTAMLPARQRAAPNASPQRTSPGGSPQRLAPDGSPPRAAPGSSPQRAAPDGSLPRRAGGLSRSRPARSGWSPRAARRRTR